VGYAGIDPNKGMDAFREVRRAVKELGLRGISMDPCYHKAPANDKRYYPIYAVCCDLGVPVMLTAGPAPRVPETVIEHAAPRTVDEVARDFPDLTIIVGHAGWPWVREMVAVAMRHRHVYFEMSVYEEMPGMEDAVRAANSVLADKVLFASAHPFVPTTEALRRYRSLGFAPPVLEKILHANGARILGLTG
jgi:predicted TIM-barrel fold metal-dependent hydrolase